MTDIQQERARLRQAIKTCRFELLPARCAFGELEEDALRLYEDCCMQLISEKKTSTSKLFQDAQSLKAIPLRAQLIVAASDNEYSLCGLSAYQQSDTYKLCKLCLKGKTAVNALMRSMNIKLLDALGLKLYDCGLATELKEGVYEHRIPRKFRVSNDASLGPAMSKEAAVFYLSLGAAYAKDLYEEACDKNAALIWALGEFGIANSTAASMVLASLLGRKELLEGDISYRHGLLSDKQYADKRACINKALKRYKSRAIIDETSESLELSGLSKLGKLTRTNLEISTDAELDKHAHAFGTRLADPLFSQSKSFELLCQLGSYEIAFLIGVLQFALQKGVPCILDGLLSIASAALCLEYKPEYKALLYASHYSSEPLAKYALERYGLEPRINSGLSAGEACGALLHLQQLCTVLQCLMDLKRGEGLRE